jgi:hypothetical protein
MDQPGIDPRIADLIAAFALGFILPLMVHSFTCTLLGYSWVFSTPACHRGW